MGRILYGNLKRLASVFLLASVGLGQTNAQSPGPAPANSGLGIEEKAELVDKLDQLLQQNQNLEDQARRMEEQNRRLRDEIREIREKLAGQPIAAPAQPSAQASIA
jgi:TolA-binding protein